MFDSGLFGIISTVQNAFFSRVDDDAVDRMNHCFTPLILILFTIVSGMRQFLNPIDCWPEAEIKSDGAMTSFIDQYCWVEGTYFVPKNERLPAANEAKPKRLNYYQWVPLFLLVQACMFQAPCMLWRLLNWKAGINLSVVTDLANKTGNLDSTSFDKLTSSISYHITTVLDLHHYRKYKSRSRARRMYWCCTRMFHHYGGLFMTCCYLLSKLLYCMNAFVQIYVLTRFVSEDSVFFGWKHAGSLLEGSHWLDNGHFPRLAFCEVDIRKNGGQNVHTYVLQCVLPINLIHEKLFIFLWFWYAMLACVTFYNVINWLYQCALSRNSQRFVFKFLKLASLQNRKLSRNKDKVPDRKTCVRFVCTYLSNDGVLVLRLLEYNCGFTVTFEVLKRLWSHYQDLCSSNSSSPVNLLLSASAAKSNAFNGGGSLNFSHDSTANDNVLLRASKGDDQDVSAV